MSTKKMSCNSTHIFHRRKDALLSRTFLSPWAMMAATSFSFCLGFSAAANAQLVIGNQNTNAPPGAVQINLSDPVSITITDTNQARNALEVQMPNGFVANTQQLFVTANSPRQFVAAANVAGIGATMRLGGTGFGGTVVVTNNSTAGGSAVGAFNGGVLFVSNTTAVSPVGMGGASFFTQCTTGGTECSTTQIMFGANNVAHMRGSDWGVLAGPGGTQSLGGSQIVPLFIGETGSRLVGTYGGGILNVAANTVLTNSINSDDVSGVWSSSGGISNLASGTTISLGNASNLNGVVAESGTAAANTRSAVNGTDIDVNLNGNGSKGAWASRGGLVNLAGGTLDATGANTIGLLASERNGAFNSSGTTSGTVITANGAGATALAMVNSGSLSITGGSASALGSGTTGLFSTNILAVANVATLTNTTVASAGGASIHVNGGLATIAMTNVRMTANNGIWLNTDSGIQASTLDLSATASTISGAATTQAGNVANVSLAGTAWTMTGNSNVTSLVNDTSRISFTGPGGDPSQLASYKTLTAGNYHGVGGTVVLNTYLARDGAPSDRLVIDGGRATGTTTLLVNNTSGPGGQTTGDGIMVIQALNGAVTGTGLGDQSTFRLGSRVAAGAYEYLLFYGGRAETGGNTNDQNWYLRNTMDNPDDPNGPDVPIVRPEVPVSMVIPPLAIEYGYTMLGTMHERIGETWINPGPATEDRIVWCKDPAKNFRCTVRVPVASANGARDETRWARSGWARLIGDRGFNEPGNFMRRGPDYNYTFGGIEAGLDIYAREQADGTLDKAGIYVGYGQISSDVKGQFGRKAGSVDMDAYTVAAYWTHFSPNGWYTDAIVQGTWYAADAKSIYGQSIKPEGYGILGSLEGGYSFKLGSGWALEPQAQIVYQNVSFDHARDAYGFVTFDDGDSLRGRLGLRLAKTWNMAENAKPRLITGWLRANIWHEFLGKTTTSWGSLDGSNLVPFTSSLGGTWGEIGAGVTAQVSDTINIFATGTYNRSLDDKGRQGWGGRLGATVKW